METATANFIGRTSVFRHATAGQDPCHISRFLLRATKAYSAETLWCVTCSVIRYGLINPLIPAAAPNIIIIAAGCIWQGIMGSHSLAWWEWTVLTPWSREDSSLTRFPAAWEPSVRRQGIWGAIIGAIVGAILFPPIVGLLVMPFLGALLAELIFARKDIAAAFKAGSGAALGMLTGLLLEFTCGLLIIAWFCSCYFLF